MKLQGVFEVEKWVELEDQWVFKASKGHNKVILVKEGISFMDFVDNIYAKLRLSKDMFEISLSYLPHTSRKMT